MLGPTEGMARPDPMIEFAELDAQNLAGRGMSAPQRRLMHGVQLAPGQRLILLNPMGIPIRYVRRPWRRPDHTPVMVPTVQTFTACY